MTQSCSGQVPQAATQHGESIALTSEGGKTGGKTAKEPDVEPIHTENEADLPGSGHAEEEAGLPRENESSSSCASISNVDSPPFEETLDNGTGVVLPPDGETLGCSNATFLGRGHTSSPHLEESAPRECESSAPVCPKWSEVLCSPSTGGAYSPSRELNRSGSLHGLGLTVAVDRAKTLSKCGKRCATLLFDVSGLYDAFALSILKACQSMGNSSASPAVCAPPVVVLMTEANRCLVSFAKQIQGLAICIKGSIARPLHGSMSAVAETVPNIYSRYALTRVKSLNARQDALKMRMRYVKSIREAEVAIWDLKQAKAAADAKDRGQEVREESKIAANVAPAPAATTTLPKVDLQEESNHSQPLTAKSGETESNSSSPSTKKRRGWERTVRMFGGRPGLSKAVDRVVVALREVEVTEAQYVSLVEEENHAVSRSQTMELMALEALQKLEEERLQFFIETLGRSLQAEKGALDNMSLSIREGDSLGDSAISGFSSGEGPQAAAVVSTFPTFTMRKTTSTSPSVGDAGAAEAASLGLPEEVGALRDNMRANLASRTIRAQTVKVLVMAVEEISSATGTFASSLNARFSFDGYITKRTKNSDPLSVNLKQNEGPRALKCWNKMVKELEESAGSASALASELRDSNRTNLDNFLLSAEKDLKMAKESEDGRWKQLCDAARQEAKAKARYEQSKSSLERARGRLSTQGAASVSRSSAPAPSSSKMNSTMKKALGNMFSMLPHGEDAMASMLTADARRDIAKTNLDEAEQREARDRLALSSATAAREEAVESYTTRAKAVEGTFRTDDEACWGAMRVTLESLIGSFQTFRDARYESVGSATATITECGVVGSRRSNIMEDMTDWTKQMEEKLATHLEQSESNKDEATAPKRVGKSKLPKVPKVVTRRQRGGDGGGDSENGFCLDVRLEESKTVYKLLRLVGSDADETEEEDSQLLEGDSESETGLVTLGVHSEAHSPSVIEPPSPRDENDEALRLNHPDNMTIDEGEAESPLEGGVFPSPAKPDVGGGKALRRSVTAPADCSAGTVGAPAPTKLPSESTRELLSLVGTRLRDSVEQRDRDGNGGGGSKTPPKGFLVAQTKSNKAAEGAERTAQAVPKSSSTGTKTTETTAETEIFLAHFWEGESGEGDDGDDSSSPPTVIESFSCAYWPKEDEGFLTPLLHGRLFTTASAMYFVGWGGKKIVLNWEDVVSVAKATTMMGTVDNALRITFDSGDGVGTYFFGSFAFRENAFQLLNRLSAVAKSLNELSGSKSKKNSLPSVPPDEVLKKMEPMLSKKMKGVSITRFYDIAWSEGNGTDAKPLYGPWLEKNGSHDVIVGDWDVAEDGADFFVNQWCGEKYSHKRVVTFKFKRTTHLYVGPPIAGVTQTQYCRVEGNDKIVLAMTVTMDGIPYADTFAVEVRWVTRRSGGNLTDLIVDAGVVVDFKKSTMFAKQIRSGTVVETKPVHLNLFKEVKDICDAEKGLGEGDEGMAEEEEEIVPREGDVPPITISSRLREGVVVVKKFGHDAAESPLAQYAVLVVAFCVAVVLSWRFFPPPRRWVPDVVSTRNSIPRDEFEYLSHRMDEVSEEMKELRESVGEILSLLKERHGE